MLDLEKEEFVEEMNFKTKIPKLIAKISNTYYTKVSNLFIINPNYS